MRVFCITLRGPHSPYHGVGIRTPERTRAHLSERGVDAHFFYGIDANKLRIASTVPYEIDTGPGLGVPIEPPKTGCWLSHRALWAALLLFPDELFLILEDDARFPEDWEARTSKAIEDAGDFDVLFIGSCCTLGKPKRHISGDVYEVRWPMCMHGYVVRRSALETLIDTQDEARCYAPIDVSLVLHTFDRLRAYTVLPRILDQFDTYLPE